MEYIIVGDTAEYKECLVYTCGKSKERAKEVLSRRDMTFQTSEEQTMLQAWLFLKMANLRKRNIASLKSKQLKMKTAGGMTRY